MNWYKKSVKKIPKKNMRGDCYEISGRYITDHCFMGEKDLLLVHGEVTGQGAIEGILYGHAWIEKGGLVIDKSNGRDLQLPKELYYALGRIEKTFKYNCEEARKKILQYKHWGPWELITQY